MEERKGVLKWTCKSPPTAAGKLCYTVVFDFKWSVRIMREMVQVQDISRTCWKWQSLKSGEKVKYHKISHKLATCSISPSLLLPQTSKVSDTKQLLIMRVKTSWGIFRRTRHECCAVFPLGCRSPSTVSTIDLVSPLWEEAVSTLAVGVLFSCGSEAPATLVELNVLLFSS